MILKENLDQKISNAETVFKISKELLDSRQKTELHKEYFYTFYLNSQNIIKCIDLSAFGTINHCSPIIREILRLALIKDATSIIIVHNHPSGTLTASNDDRAFTTNLKKAGDLIGVVLLDSIIIGKDNYFSFSDNGIM